MVQSTSSSSQSELRSCATSGSMLSDGNETRCECAHAGRIAYLCGGAQA